MGWQPPWYQRWRGTRSTFRTTRWFKELNRPASPGSERRFVRLEPYPPPSHSVARNSSPSTPRPLPTLTNPSPTTPRRPLVAPKRGCGLVDEGYSSKSASNSSWSKVGPAWQDGDYVFTNRVGGPIDQDNLLKREFRPLLKQAGVRPDATVRDLRHTAISLALSQGTAATDVSEMAGHSNVGVTLSVYAHALPGAPKRATDSIAAALAGA